VFKAFNGYQISFEAFQTSLEAFQVLPEPFKLSLKTFRKPLKASPLQSVSKTKTFSSVSSKSDQPLTQLEIADS
jgi:hypothetical protein